MNVFIVVCATYSKDVLVIPKDNPAIRFSV